MTDVSAMVAELIEAGCAPDVAAKVVAGAFVAGVSSATFRGIPVDESAEKRRAYDRERKRKSAEIRRNSTESAEIPNDALVDINITKTVRGRGTRLPPEFRLPPEGREFCKKRGWSDAQIDETFANFCDYWLAKPGSGGVKLDWLRTWRKWVRDTKIKPAANSAAPMAVVADTDWRAVLTTYKRTGHWSKYAGADPASPSCRAPKELLREFGYEPPPNSTGASH